MKKLMEFIKKEDGVTAIEYSLIAALLGVVIVGAVTAAGDQVTALFQRVADTLTAALL